MSSEKILRTNQIIPEIIAKNNPKIKNWKKMPKTKSKRNEVIPKTIGVPISNKIIPKKMEPPKIKEIATPIIAITAPPTNMKRTTFNKHPNHAPPTYKKPRPIPFKNLLTLSLFFIDKASCLRFVKSSAEVLYISEDSSCFSSFNSLVDINFLF